MISGNMHSGMNICLMTKPYRNRKVFLKTEAIEALLQEILEVRLRPGAGSAVYIMISVKRIMLQVRYREQST